MGFLAAALSPPRCPVCGRVLQKRTPCPDCAGRLRRLELANCPQTAGVDATVCGWRYDKEVKRGIRRMKFAHRPADAENWALQLLCNEKAYTFAKEFDIIVPVPSAKGEKQSRGYDVPRLLACAVGECAGAAVAAPGVLVKRRETRRQVELNGEERRKNLVGAFCVQKPEEIEGRRVLLVDDVTTTGATLLECARALREAKPKKLGALTLAAALPGQDETTADRTREGRKRRPRVEPGDREEKKNGYE